MTLFEKVKANLILDTDADDEILQSYIDAATDYAASFEHKPEGYYDTNPMTPHYRAGRHHAVVPLLRKSGRQHGRLF